MSVRRESCVVRLQTVRGPTGSNQAQTRLKVIPFLVTPKEILSIAEQWNLTLENSTSDSCPHLSGLCLHGAQYGKRLNL